MNSTLTRQLLQDTAVAYRTQINDLLLAALARVICRWTGQDSTPRSSLRGMALEMSRNSWT